MADFAKLYRFDAVGQVLVTLDDDGEDDVVRIRYRLEHPSGVTIQAAMGTWQADDAGWNNAQKAFDRVNETRAEKIASELFEMLEANGALSGLVA